MFSFKSIFPVDWVKNLTDKFLQLFGFKIKQQIPAITIDVKRILEKHIKAHPTYDSLIMGDLVAEFGFYPNEAKGITDRVVEYIISLVKINSINNTIRISLDTRDIDSEQFSYISQPSGATVSWFSWLLNAGTNIVVADYVIGYASNLRGSRSGKAIMIEIDGGSYSVPPEYAGTVENNWITQSIKSAQKEIDAILLNRVNDVFKNL